MTAAHMAAANGHVEVLRLLVELKANINAADEVVVRILSAIFQQQMMCWCVFVYKCI